MLYRLRALLSATFAVVILLLSASSVEGARSEKVERKRERVVKIASKQIGDPYSWGASGPGAFDCSGLTRYVYREIGISLPHNAAAQYYSTRHVERPKRGDLVFFSGLGHVGLYVGGNRFIHAPNSGSRVRRDSLAGRAIAAFGRVIR